MKLIDVKLPKLSKKDTELKAEPMEDRDRWPYGLKLTFESEQVDKIPLLEKVKIGQSLDIEGMGEVTSIRMHEQKDGKKQYTVEVQLHKVGCEGSSSKESMGEALNRANRNRVFGG